MTPQAIEAALARMDALPGALASRHARLMAELVAPVVNDARAAIRALADARRALAWYAFSGHYFAGERHAPSGETARPVPVGPLVMIDGGAKARAALGAP